MLSQGRESTFDGTSVPGFTCLNLNGNIYRAHPSYRSGEEWFDHVSVK